MNARISVFARISGTVVAAAAILGACGGVDNTEIYSEPILVHGAQFFPGELPGAPEPPPDAASAPVKVGPSITTLQVSSTTIYSAESSVQVSGDADETASAIAIRLGELGTGYWVFPIGGPDPEVAGQLTFGALVDFNPTISTGNQQLRVVAVTSDGKYGVQNDQPLCIASRLPGDPGTDISSVVTACAPAINPPAAIFALTWDANVDLDLHVITPSGADVNPKAPILNRPDAGQAVPVTSARIDRDSLAYCVADGWREEDLVFPSLPPSGSTYQIRANLFSACNLGSVTFTLTVYEAVGTPGVNLHLVSTLQRTGILTSVAADGDSPGTLIVSYPF